jgi:acyl-CoA thioesterase-2
MGDLALDTAVERVGPGRYRATLSEDWRIWGPMGGYVASVALRAVGAETAFVRPASFSCHYLGVADFAEVDIEVVALRGGRTADSHRVTITQGSRPILEATVWAIGDVEGLVHDTAVAPDVPDPLEVPTRAERMGADEVPFPFWANFEERPVTWSETWPPSAPAEPVFRDWMRFLPTSTFSDPWLDACRSLVILDIQCWPSAVPQHAHRWGLEQPWMAPSLDLYVSFHAPCPDSAWLLADGCAPVGGDGLIGWNGRAWSVDRHLVASAAGQMLCRRL